MCFDTFRHLVSARVVGVPTRASLRQGARSIHGARPTGRLPIIEPHLRKSLIQALTEMRRLKTRTAGPGIFPDPARSNRSSALVGRLADHAARQAIRPDEQITSARLLRQLLPACP